MKEHVDDEVGETRSDEDICSRWRGLVDRCRGAERKCSRTGARNARASIPRQHQPKPLTFDPAKLKGLSERLIHSHHENNYAGAVRALNAVERRLDMLMRDKDIPPFVYGPLKREELHRTGSVVLHEHYFANLGGDGKPAGAVLDAIRQSYGSAEAWDAEFRRTAASLGGASGWVVLAFNLHARELHNYWAWDHMHNVPTGVSLPANFGYRR